MNIACVGNLRNIDYSGVSFFTKNSSENRHYVYITSAYMPRGLLFTIKQPTYLTISILFSMRVPTFIFLAINNIFYFMCWTGKKCDQCQDGYWNIESGNGCMSCDCHSIGATTGKCDQDTGTCDCLPGVTGQHCDQCRPNHYKLSREGCTCKYISIGLKLCFDRKLYQLKFHLCWNNDNELKICFTACECSTVGSADLQCNEDGYCECKEGVLGVKCDECQENYFDISSGCIGT